MYQQKEETRRKGLEGAYSLIFFKSSACLTGFFFLRYSRWVRRSATNPRRPRRECLSLRFFLRCFDKSSMRFEIRLTWTSGEPVSLSCRADDLMIVAFFFGESAMRGIVAYKRKGGKTRPCLTSVSLLPPTVAQYKGVRPLTQRLQTAVPRTPRD